MLSATEVVHDLVRDIMPGDAVEAEHQANTLHGWRPLRTCFGASSRDPDRHLVSYGAILDPADGSSLLVDHINAGLWLPPGGHVEPGEHPAASARREIREELAIEAVFIEDAARPSFITVTRTTGTDRGHLDVSLWFLLVGERGMPLTIDRAEFTDACWWTPADVLAAGPGRFDPHYWRFMTKMRR